MAAASVAGATVGALLAVGGEPILKLRQLSQSVGVDMSGNQSMLNGSMIPRSVKRVFDERSEPREAAESHTAVLEMRGRKHMVRLANISSSGAMVIFQAMPHIGEDVVLNVMDRGRVKGRVLWVRDGRIGVQFAAPLE